MLAALLQTPESFSKHLQRPCKRRKVFRSTCSVPANSKKFFGAFAALLQRPKSFSRHLQRSCKRQKVFRSTRSIAANAERFSEALAAFLQTPESFSKHWQRLCKHQKVFRGICSNAAKTFSRDKTPHAFVELTYRRGRIRLRRRLSLAPIPNDDR